MGIGLYRAVNWWLRSPNSSNNNNAYNVNTDGSVNNNNVYNGNNCARPALAGKYAEALPFYMKHTRRPEEENGAKRQKPFSRVARPKI